MKRPTNDVIDLFLLSPWVATQRISRLPFNPCDMEGLLAWQAWSFEKWLGAWEAGAGAMHAMMATPGRWSPDRVAAAMLAPVARRVRANARQGRKAVSTARR